MKRTRTRKTGLFIVILAAVLMTFLFLPQKSEAATDYSIIRVNLSIGTVKTLNITIDGNYTLKEKPETYLYRKVYTVKTSGSAIALYDGSTLLYSGSAFTLVQNQKTSGLDNTISLKNSEYGNTSYLGSMKFSPIKLTVNKVTGYYVRAINYVYLEEYLYGVVPHEMSNSFPLEALKAQAVFARGYAVKNMDASAGYDVVDTSANQVYEGYDASDTNAIKAVDATKYKVLKYGSSIVATYFSASNGGYTEATVNVWTPAIPKAYQVVREDPYDTRNPSTPYEKKYFPCAVNDAASYPGLDRIKSYYIMPLLKKAGYVDKQGEELSVTTDFTWKNLISMTGTVPASHTKYKNYNCGCTHVESLIMQIKVGTYQKVVNPSTNLTTYNPVDVILTITMPASDFLKWGVFDKDKLCAYFIIPNKDSSGNLLGYYLRHARYGHGCGLSQRGTQQMANEGWAYTKIIDFYYPHTTISTLSNITVPVLTPRTEIAPNAILSANTQFVSSAASNSGVIFTLSKNTKIYVSKSFVNNDWHQVICNGYAGYVSKDVVSFISVAAVTANNAAVKQSAATTASNVAVIGNGVIVKLLRNEGAWNFIEWNGRQGYLPVTETAASNGREPTAAAVGTMLSATVAKAGPGAAYSDFYRIEKGTAVKTIQKNVVSGWHKVWVNGNIAYVPASSVLYKPAITGIAKITASSAVIRVSPSNSSGKVTTLKKGKTVEVVKKYYNSGWHQVWYNNKLCYVSKSGVSVGSGTKATVAVATQLKAAASASSATVSTLSLGKTVYIYGSSGSFFYVNCSGTTGYVAKSLISPVSPATKPSTAAYCYPNAASVVVRNSPNTASVALGTIAKGTTLNVIAKYYYSDWHQIWYNGKYGYVNKSGISFYSTKTGVSKVSKLYLRATASSNGTILKTIGKGTRFIILSKGSKWHKAYYSGKTGYVSASSVSVK